MEHSILTHEDPRKSLPADALQRVNEICMAVDEVRDSRELLEVSLKHTLELFGAKRGSVFLLDKNGKDLVLHTSAGMKIDEQKKMVKRLGEGVMGRVAEAKQPLFVDDIEQDVRFHNYKSRQSYKTPSFICAPLLIKDKLIGVINIADKESGERFKEYELQLLDFLASQIALNFRRIELYQKFKTIVKESRTLKDQLGKRRQEAVQLKEQIVIHEKLASIGKLAGGIAHEFNNPLDGVIRYTNLSLEHLKDSEVVRGYLLEIKQGLNRMAKIVRSLLACSRNEQPTMQKVDINHAVEQAISSIRSDIFQKNITIQRDFANDTPPLTDMGLERVISNLLRNAVEAVPADTGKIKIATFYAGGQLKVEVTDNGCGIAKDNIQTIFEPFFTTKDIEKGCGLGLTIVSEIVKSYNGRIEVDSAPGTGTTFIITLPLEEKI
jgi:signal transduction histidine kinase